MPQDELHSVRRTTMTSSYPGTVLHRESDRKPLLCQAVNISVPGFAVCSLREGTHDLHQLRCEATGELLGEWTDADTTFREPTNEIQRYIEFSSTPMHEIGDVA
ncbi:hypothetical protein [Rhodococcus sp. Leaf233]|uniref:hypothetical protein n=1 Tax=Rhodococcus sp. Leaf233 TaxID=1736302 RepID=UPI0012E37D4C|nr:hypothetical protein [Rhodococcus sp. Leaf233]